MVRKNKIMFLSMALLLTLCIQLICFNVQVQATTNEVYSSQLEEINTVYANEGGLVTLDEEPVPQARHAGGYSLINVVCCIGVIALSIVLLLIKDTKYTEVSKKRMWAKGFSLIAALDVILIFVLTQDMSLPMQMSDQWTYPMVLILLAQVLIVFVGLKGISFQKHTLSK